MPQELLELKLKNAVNFISDLRNAFNSKKNDLKKFYLYGDGIHFSKAGHRVLQSI